MPTRVAPILSGKLWSLWPLTFHLLVQVLKTRLAAMVCSHFLKEIAQVYESI